MRLATLAFAAYTGIGARKLQISHQIPEFPKMHQKSGNLIEKMQKVHLNFWNLKYKFFLK